MLRRKVCATIITYPHPLFRAANKIRGLSVGFQPGQSKRPSLMHCEQEAGSYLTRRTDKASKDYCGMFNVLSFELTAFSSRCVQATLLAEHSMRRNKAIRPTSIQLMMRR